MSSARRRRACAKLRLDAIDLLLIHWPNPRVPLAETLGAMAKLQREGHVRAIGVSNFTVALLEEAIQVSPEPVVCNQFECHPFLNQDKVIAACKQARLWRWWPIARWRAAAAHGNETLARIGEAHGKTAAQVSLRYLVQQGIVVIPRTNRLERLAGEFRAVRFRARPTPRCSEIHGLVRPRRPYRRLDLVAEVGLTAVCRHRWREIYRRAAMTVRPTCCLSPAPPKSLLAGRSGNGPGGKSD